MTKYLLTTIMFFLGCDTSINASKGEITTKFFLKNSQSNETTRFGFGQDINFNYSIENRTENSYSYLKQDTGPLVTFEVYKKDSLIGTSLDGLAFIPVIAEDILKAGETLTTEYNWLSAAVHQPLPVGEYTAKARPKFEFCDINSPVVREFEFRVVTMSDLLKISDLPPDSIQLDSFDLNSVAVSGNEIFLNLSYSGGCEEHEFELFMSPGAFLESNPVQANLFMRHNDKDDACDAYITTEVSFDLTPLAELYQQLYGRKGEIILNVFDYFQDQPGRHLTARYSP